MHTKAKKSVVVLIAIVLLVSSFSGGALADTPDSSMVSSRSVYIFEFLSSQGFTLTVSGSAAEITVGYNYITTGQYVRIAQAALKTLGYYTGSVDGIFGQQTSTAVYNFQSAYYKELAIDGIIGPLTWAKLNSLAPRLSYI